MGNRHTERPSDPFLYGGRLSGGFVNRAVRQGKRPHVVLYLYVYMSLMPQYNPLVQSNILADNFLSFLWHIRSLITYNRAKMLFFIRSINMGRVGWEMKPILLLRLHSTKRFISLLEMRAAYIVSCSCKHNHQDIKSCVHTIIISVHLGHWTQNCGFFSAGWGRGAEIGIWAMQNLHKKYWIPSPEKARFECAFNLQI